MPADWREIKDRLLSRPPINRLLSHRRLWFEAGPRSWGEALSRCSGYDDPSILARVGAATQAVLAGRAAMERDGVALRHLEHDPALACALAMAMESNAEPLRVVDFGGALGGTYLRHRDLVADALGRWVIVEQLTWLDVGRDLFPDEEVTFEADLSQALEVTRPDLVIIGGSLQCIFDPQAVVDAVKSSTARYILVGRTPVHEGTERLLVVEHVPPTIGRASYPMWIFPRGWIHDQFPCSQTLVDQVTVGGAMHTSSGVAFEWRDFLFDLGGDRPFHE